MDLTPGPDEDQERSDEKLARLYTVEDVEAGVRVLHANCYDGPENLDEDARIEIVALVLSTVAPKIREAAYRAGREDAARDIRAHADEHAPVDGNVQQRRLRRCLLIAARVAAGSPSMDEIAEALRSGNYAVCSLDEAGRSINLGRSAGSDPKDTSSGTEVER